MSVYDSAMTGDRKHGLAVHLGEWFDRNRATVPTHIEQYFRGTKKNPKPFGGRHFETFAGMADAGRFGPADLLAIQAPSVTIPIDSAFSLLNERAEEFNAALGDMPDGEFWEVDRKTFESKGAAMKLFALLDGLPGVGY